MDKAEFAKKTIQALNSHAKELDAMEAAVHKAAKAKTEVPNAKEIFKELSDASHECKESLEFYGDDEQIPSDVRVAMESVQEKLSECANAFGLYLASGGKLTHVGDLS